MSERDAFGGIRSQLRRWSAEDVEALLEKTKQRHEAGARLESELEQIRGSLQRWPTEKVEAMLRELRFRRGEARLRKRRLTALACALAAAAALALVLWRSTASPTREGPAQRALQQAEGPPLAAAKGVQHTPERILLRDGSQVTLANRTSEVRVDESRAEQVLVAVERGRASFRVEHQPGRRFFVEVGGVRIEDLGTVFNVERKALEVVVEVVEGKVRVVWAGHTDELSAGAVGTYPLGEPAAAAEPEWESKSAAAPDAKAAPPAQAPWQALAREGQYGPAFELLRQSGFGSVRDEASDLLLAADVARLSGHPSEAVTPLRNLIRRHRADPRSPAAAFTLGSVLLRNLGRPGEAAVAFEEALRLAPAGNLAEDAMARAAEAWLRAGDRARAEAALQRYRSAHPAGRHLASLKRLIQTPR